MCLFGLTKKGWGWGSLRFLSSSFGFLPELSDSISGEFVSQLNEVMVLIYKGFYLKQLMHNSLNF